MVWKECNRVSERKEFVLLASVLGPICIQAHTALWACAG